MASQADLETAGLVRRVQAGDGDAFEPLVRRFMRAGFAVALSVVGRPADAEDVVQDAIGAALEQIDSCRDPERFAGWLMQIVRNRARNLLDARRVREPGGSRAAESSHTDHDRTDTRKALETALATLNEVPRAVVLLHDLEGWTHGEIAESLGISEVMSRQHLFQARRTLREQLGENAEE